MMLYSMTGFARRQSSLPDGRQLEITIRSVNHRFLEIQVYAIDSLAPLETDIRQAVSARLSRGKVTINARFSGSPRPSGDVLNQEFIKKVSSEWKELLPDIEVPGSILGLPGSFIQETGSLPEEIKVEVLATVDSALKELLKIRGEEADHLLPELNRYLDEINSTIDTLEGSVDEILDQVLTEIRVRLDELIGEEVNEERIITEAGILSMRMDIREEIVRAKRFAESMKKMIQNPEGAIGKELNFYTQELHREINTMGQKLRDFSLRELTLKAKLANEKFREQIQNVE